MQKRFPPYEHVRTIPRPPEAEKTDPEEISRFSEWRTLFVRIYKYFTQLPAEEDVNNSPENTGIHTPFSHSPSERR